MSDTILDILASIPDNLLGLTAQAMGLETEFKKDNNRLAVYLQAGFPTFPLETSLLPTLTKALQCQYPTLSIDLALDFFIKAHRTQLLGKGLRGVKNTIAIASGKGGVGKSTVTVNLATALAHAGAKVGILDADIYGPSIPLMLGKHSPIQVNDAHYLPVQIHGIQAMSIGYLAAPSQALIWRGPMLAKSFLQMLDMTLWDDLDYLLIDLPPGTGDIQLSLVQKIPLTTAIIVTTPQTIATSDAQKALKMFETTGIHVLGIIENMSAHICTNCGYKEDFFGQGGAKMLSNMFKVPLLGQLPLDSQIRRHCDEGVPIATKWSPHQDNNLVNTVMKTALTVAITLAKQPLNYVGKFPPVVVE